MKDERITRAEDLEAEAKRLREDVESNPPERRLVPYLHEDGPGRYRVGARDEPQLGDYPYNGPCAHVYVDDHPVFFFVGTDHYEGTAMLNIEALPKLIEALQRLEAHIASAVTPETQG